MPEGPTRTDKVVVLVRHGETEWSRDGRHTSVTDLPLTPRGEDAARRLAPPLRAWDFATVLTSPRQRAVRTAELAGFSHPEADPDLVEWDYGAYEGRTTAQIRAERPAWNLWADGVPPGETLGESPEEVQRRARRVVARVLESTDRGGNVLLVSHGHVLRAVVAAWVDLPPDGGAHFMLDTATLSVLGFEHGDRAVRRWNAPVG